MYVPYVLQYIEYIALSSACPSPSHRTAPQSIRVRVNISAIYNIIPQVASVQLYSQSFIFPNIGASLCFIRSLYSIFQLLDLLIVSSVHRAEQMIIDRRESAVITRHFLVVHIVELRG
jgi:hypothetical protein